VGGMIRAYDLRPLLGRYEDVCSSLFMGVRPQQVRPDGPLTYLPTANLLVRRSMWRQIGGFALLTFGEDVDFCRRLLLTGATITYLPQGAVYHDYRTDLGAFLRIRASYASAEAVLLQRHPTERRILVLPPEQALFAASTIGAAWATAWRAITRRTTASLRAGASPAPTIHVYGRGDPCGRPRVCPRPQAGEHPRTCPIFMFALAFVLTMLGTWVRLRKVRAQRIPVGPLAVFKATLRSYLAYTYHLWRHLTRYYTLPLLLASLLCPPLFPLAGICCGIVIVVDYIRSARRPSWGNFLQSNKKRL
jgi:hypothetical protein